MGEHLPGWQETLACKQAHLIRQEVFRETDGRGESGGPQKRSDNPGEPHNRVIVRPVPRPGRPDSLLEGAAAQQFWRQILNKYLANQ